MAPFFGSLWARVAVQSASAARGRRARSYPLNRGRRLRHEGQVPVSLRVPNVCTLTRCQTSMGSDGCGATAVRGNRLLEGTRRSMDLAWTRSEDNVEAGGGGREPASSVEQARRKKATEAHRCGRRRLGPVGEFGCRTVTDVTRFASHPARRMHGARPPATAPSIKRLAGRSRRLSCPARRWQLLTARVGRVYPNGTDVYDDENDVAVTTDPYVSFARLRGSRQVIPTARVNPWPLRHRAPRIAISLTKCLFSRTVRGAGERWLGVYAFCCDALAGGVTRPSQLTRLGADCGIGVALCVRAARRPKRLHVD